jgi:hypothetical protein
MTKSKGGTPVQQGSLLEPLKGEIKVGDKITGNGLEGETVVSVLKGRKRGGPPADKTDAYDRKPSKAVAIAPPQQQVALKSSGDPMVDMYERALRDPAVDPAKLKALLDIRAEETAREAHRHFNVALNDAQAKIPRIFANKKNSSTNSRYADYPSLDAAIRPIYVGAGFGLSFNTGESKVDNHVLVYCDVSNAGHVKRYQIDMPADGKGAKGGDVMTKTHATGSAVSYGMRYLLIMIFNIPIIKDDDGNGAGKKYQQPSQEAKSAQASAGFPGDLITAAQIKIIDGLIADANISAQNFCVKYGLAKVGDLPAELFDAAKKAIADHKAKAAK